MVYLAASYKLNINPISDTPWYSNLSYSYFIHWEVNFEYSNYKHDTYWSTGTKRSFDGRTVIQTPCHHEITFLFVDCNIIVV